MRGALRVAVALWFLAAGRVFAQSEMGEPLLELLERWTEDPPEIGEVDAEDLALLPWLDLRLAESILGLHAAGAVHVWEDLLLVPGLDGPTVDALRSLLRLPGDQTGASRWAIAGRVSTREGALHRQSELSWLNRGLALHLSTRDAADSRLTLAVSTTRRSSRWQGIVGHFRLSGIWQPADASMSSRSRVAPVGLPRGVLLRPHRSPSTRAPWTGGALLRSSESTTALLCLDEVDRRAAFLAEFRRGLVSGARVDLGARRSPRLSAWLQSAPPSGLQWRTHWVARSSAAVAWRVRWTEGEAGFAATTASGTAGGGPDPLTGRLLDRSHEAWQAHSRVRGAGLDLLLLHRRLRRGIAPEEGLLLLELARSGGSGRWRIRARHRSDADGPAGESLRIGWDSPTLPWGGRLRGGAALEGRAGGLGRLWELALASGGSGVRWGAQLAFSDGQHSMLHVISVPASHSRPQWLSRGESSVSLGLALPIARIRLGGWLGGAFGPLAARPELEGGLECALLSGDS